MALESSGIGVRGTIMVLERDGHGVSKRRWDVRKKLFQLAKAYLHSEKDNGGDGEHNENRHDGGDGDSDGEGTYLQ
jgi:hypothetical protein